MDRDIVRPLNYKSMGTMTIELCSPHELLIGVRNGDLRLHDLCTNENLLIASKNFNPLNFNMCVQYV